MYKKILMFLLICFFLTGCTLESERFSDETVETSVDSNVLSENEDLAMEETSLSELKERAKTISNKYIVDIYLENECLLDYSAYTAVVLDNTRLISESLDILEQSLSKYPENFMKQLQFGAITSIRIELVASLQLKDHMKDGIDAAAFAEEKHDYFLMVFDVNQLSESTFHHETAHLIDKRLGWENIVKKGTMFSEEAWLKLQPDGFDYTYSYSLEAEMKEYYDESYFVSEYSCTYPTEDRATMMEMAMMGYKEEFVKKPKLKEKLKYYGKCMRECFDTENWPEIAKWEEIYYE